MARRISVFGVAALSGACASAPDAQSDLEARLDALEADNAALRDELGRYALRTELDAFAQRSDLEPYALSADLEAYAQLADLDDYALKTDLSPYALVSDLDDYALTSDLDDYALLGETVRYRDVTLVMNVPGQFPTIADALDSLDGLALAPGTDAWIVLAPGTYDYANPVAFDNPSVTSLVVRGPYGDPSAVLLRFPKSGLTVGPGCIMEVHDVTLQGSDHPSSVGVDAWGGGVALLEGVVVRDFNTGIRAALGGIVQGISVESNSNVTGYQAQDGGTMWVAASRATSNIVGYRANTGGFINASASSMSGNTTNTMPAATANGDGTVYRP